MDITLAVITVLSLIVAVVMGVVSWRLVRDERTRSVARVAALAADIHDVPFVGDLFLRTEVDTVTAMPALAEMFASAQATPERSRLALAATIVLAVGAVVSIAVRFGGFGASTSGRPIADGRAPVVTDHGAKAASAMAAPLELVALGHERDADGLIVRGVLRNPSSGSEVDALTAVVLLFNHDGGLVASGRAAVEAAKLEPGGETTFVVTVPGAAEVERYRVSFRSDNRVLPHVDHRS